MQLTWLHKGISIPVPKGLAKLGTDIVAETLFLVMFPWLAKLAENKQNILLSQWQNEETLLRKQMSYACVLPLAPPG